MLIEVYEKTFEQEGITYEEDKLKQIIQENESYKEFDSKILDQFDAMDNGEFKGAFKKKFNDHIVGKAKKCKDEKEFGSELPEYYEWIEKDVLNKLRGD